MLFIDFPSAYTHTNHKKSTIEIRESPSTQISFTYKSVDVKGIA